MFRAQENKSQGRLVTDIIFLTKKKQSINPARPKRKSFSIFLIFIFMVLPFHLNKKTGKKNQDSITFRLPRKLV